MYFAYFGKIASLKCLREINKEKLIEWLKGEAVGPQIIWNDELGGNIDHIEEHGVTVDDVEHVLAGSKRRS